MDARFSLSMDMSRLTRDGTAEPSRETKFSDANAGREVLIFSFQLTTCSIGSLTRLIHNLAVCVTIHTYTIHMDSSNYTYYSKVVL